MEFDRFELDTFETPEESSIIPWVSRHENGHDVLDIYIRQPGLVGVQVTNLEQIIQCEDIDPVYLDITGSEVPPPRSWPIFKLPTRFH